MNFENLNRLTRSLIPYKIALVIAVAILILIAGLSYRQIKNLQISSEWVAQYLKVDKEINNLFSQYSLLESAHFRSIILKDSTFQGTYGDYENKSEQSLALLFEMTRDIPDHQRYLDSISQLKDSLFVALDALDKQVRMTDTLEAGTMLKVQEAANILKRLKGFKTAMILKKDSLLKKRTAKYIAQSTFTPLTSLLLALFSIVVFGIAFYKISGHKKRIQYSESFLYNILQSTDNIINYYEPIHQENEIVDFKVVFANQGNKDYLDISPQAITGKPVSMVFPNHLLNGEMEEMINAFKKRKIVSFNRQVAVTTGTLWFRIIISPMKQGLTVTMINTTPERNEKENLRVLNEKLRNQNVELNETKIFLEAILSSTDNVIMSFEPITNENSEIIDFKYKYLNEQGRGIVGFSPENMIGRKVSEVSPSIFKSGVFEKMVACYSLNEPRDYETCYERDGKKYWFRGKAIKSGNGITITSTDITDIQSALNKLIILNEELEIRNSILSEAEVMAQIGSYTFFLDSATSVISDNFYRLLGCEPHEFDPSFETFRKFVHPSDLEYYGKIGKQILDDQKTEIYNYRIITKQGKVKNLRTNGDFRLRGGKSVLVGVVQDVTDQMEFERKLRNRNLDLKRSNEELESFSRVASHDLQEPLRKIQMFLSRIGPDEKEQLPDSVRQNLDKVNDAAMRMQSLIINLLTYSRIDSKHENFEKVNMNEVVEKVMGDLAVPIHEAKVRIVIENLPTVKGVAYQLEQVFNNLIANAIKYRTRVKTSKIVLRSEKVHRNQIAEQFHKSSLHYHKLTTLDNGIGFAPEYADKIFELFERLHQKTEYSGTGIGLAICKKIIENHHGHICADGDPGKGAAFIIYLPA